MNLTNPRATFGLNAKATPTKSGTTGTITIGDANESITTDAMQKAVSFDAVIVGSASDLIIDISDLDNTGSTTWTAGVPQVETNTVVAASGCTSNGNMTLVVTSAGMTGSPKNVVVPLTTAAHTTAALIATAARTTLSADAAVAARFTISGTGADVVLTRKPTSTYTINGSSVPVYPANDATANLAIPSGLGVTADSTSTDTTAGVATAGAYCPDLDGTDFEGEPTGGLTNVLGVFIRNNDSSVATALLTQSTILTDYPIRPSTRFQVATQDSILPTDDIMIEPSADSDQSCYITVTIIGA